jgi:lipopolysaccharide transport system permease protein
MPVKSGESHAIHAILSRVRTDSASSLPHTQAPATPLPLLIIEPRDRWLDRVAPDFPELWRHRELLYFLAWRDLKIRYKQTAIGIGWVLLQPLLTTLVFAAVFGRFVNVPASGAPYALFALCGLVPWLYCAQAVTRASLCLVVDAQLLTKVYFPRLLLPVSAVLTPLVDACLSFACLLIVAAAFGVMPAPRLLAAPLFFGLATMTALAIGLWLSVLNLKYRDVSYLLPFATQLWMFMSPVVYPLEAVPARWEFVWRLNPMTTVIEGVRWSVIGGAQPNLRAVIVSTLIVLILLAAGLVRFRAAERSFADTV